MLQVRLPVSCLGEWIGVALWRETELGLILKELPGISGLAVVSSCFSAVLVFHSFGY